MFLKACFDTGGVSIIGVGWGGFVTWGRGVGDVDSGLDNLS